MRNSVWNFHHVTGVIVKNAGCPFDGVGHENLRIASLLVTGIALLRSQHSGSLLHLERKNNVGTISMAIPAFLVVDALDQRCTGPTSFTPIPSHFFDLLPWSLESCGSGETLSRMTVSND